MSNRFGLLGESLSHSISPLLHKYLGDYSYELIERDYKGAEQLWQNHEYDGFNVTIPYKKLAYELCDELSPEAEAIGSVNTVVFSENGRSSGYNTDAFGFEYLLKRNDIDVNGKDCLILGTGGASLSVEYVLGLHNASSITFCTRHIINPSENLIEYDSLYKKADFDKISDYQIIINTTPVGMYNHDVDKSPINLEIFTGIEAVVDIIYNPIQTKLCEQAEKLGIKWASGLRMLIAQGYKASELFKSKR